MQAAAAGASGIGTTVVGTYGYMAPEQFRGAASPASDLYGLGGTLLFLLSGAVALNYNMPRLGHRPYELAASSGQTSAVLSGNPKAHTQCLKEWCTSCLQGWLDVKPLLACKLRITLRTLQYFHVPPQVYK